MCSCAGDGWARDTEEMEDTQLYFYHFLTLNGKNKTDLKFLRHVSEI